MDEQYEAKRQETGLRLQSCDIGGVVLWWDDTHQFIESQGRLKTPTETFLILSTRMCLHHRGTWGTAFFHYQMRFSGRKYRSKLSWDSYIRIYCDQWPHALLTTFYPHERLYDLKPWVKKKPPFLSAHFYLVTIRKKYLTQEVTKDVLGE